MKKFFLSIIFTILSIFPLYAEMPKFKNPDNIIQITLKNDNKVFIELRPDVAPNHVNRIKTLTREKFYDGIVFHRVIDGFMAQTGDPTGTGRGGSELPDLKAEFSRAPHLRGAVSMARSQNVDSANSQFFICFAAQHSLDAQYTYFGRVISGMEFVDQIKRGNGSRGGSVTDPDKIVSMRVLSDVLAKENL